MQKILDIIDYWFISLNLIYRFFKLNTRKKLNKYNIIRANNVNNYKFYLTLDSNEYKIVDKFSGEHIASLKYRELELIIKTSNSISIRDCKDVIRAFFNNPYLQVTVVSE